MTGSSTAARTALALAIGSLLVSAVALVVASGEEESPQWGVGSPTPAVDAEQIARLEERVAALERSLAALDLRTAGPTEEESHAGSDSTLAARVAMLEAMLGSSAAEGGLAGLPPEEILAEAELERTRRAVAEIRRREMAGKIEDWVGRELDRSEVVLSALVDKVELSHAERARVRELFEAETAAYGDLLDELYSVPEPTTAEEEELLGEHWDHAVVTMKELRVTRDAELERLLGEERMGVLRQIVKAVERRPAEAESSKAP